MKHLTCLLFFAVQSIVVAQKHHPQNYFRNPLDIPIVLSGSFGEPRSNHFHAGLDIKTAGVEGKNVYAAAAGYVSRIKVQQFGYGKAIYITHPNGYTTVYAHLSKFADEIENYVKSIQYKKESYATGNLYFKAHQFPVKKVKLLLFLVIREVLVALICILKSGILAQNTSLIRSFLVLILKIRNLLNLKLWLLTLLAMPPELMIKICAFKSP